MDNEYREDMPCNKKGCSIEERTWCCGCKEQIDWERKQKTDKKGELRNDEVCNYQGQ